jgi:hypothetical protein
MGWKTGKKNLTKRKTGKINESKLFDCDVASLQGV